MGFREVPQVPGVRVLQVRLRTHPDAPDEPDEPDAPDAPDALLSIHERVSIILRRGERLLDVPRAYPADKVEL